MENQHQKIKGYRDLTQAEIDLMNEAKALGEKVHELISKLTVAQSCMLPDEAPDPRWLAIATTDLQKGFMFLVRSIAKPTTF